MCLGSLCICWEIIKTIFSILKELEDRRHGVSVLQCETFSFLSLPVKHGDFAIVDDDDDKVGCYL